MKHKLKDLKITKVDFVNEGANPDAHIVITKGKDGTEDNIKEGTLARRITDKIVKGLAKAFSDMEDGANQPDETGLDMGMITNNIWDSCMALAVCMTDTVTKSKPADLDAALDKDISDYIDVIKDMRNCWKNGQSSNIEFKDGAEENVSIAKAAIDRVYGITANNEGVEPKNAEIPKKGESDMGVTINKSLLNPAELAFYEAIMKKAGTEEKDPDEKEILEEEKGEQKVKKSMDVVPGKGAQNNPEDIYKGLHPAVKAEMESFKKTIEKYETRELEAVAKKYEIIGKKPEDLVPVLKNLKAAGGTAYDDMIGVLDSTLEFVQKSGVFKEIGRSGHGEGDGKSAVAKAKAAAAEIKKASPELTDEQAMAKAWENDPGLWEQYDAEMRGED